MIKHSADVKVTSLGQAGFRFSFGSQIVYIDPYLSDSVEKSQGAEYRRLVPIWRAPEFLSDADWVLLTHIHLDHCDLETLLPLSKASSKCRFIGPADVCSHLVRHGIPESRVMNTHNGWRDLSQGLRIHVVPAAHPTIETDVSGNWKYVGFVIEYNGRRFYHSGDTALVPELFEHLNTLTPIDVAILPVNEHNYFRENLGIVGNMSIRDAFGLAKHLCIKTLVPMHWDMFEPNTVFREEIELFYHLTQPSFDMKLCPESI
ncbi:MAG: MBL fold metallo-hydrolase [Porticoccus sp.]|uniref:MBL fold metallo-hydrolase n=1 Tax=Porticoccus sp. TaxID=2024853 RepID=UPI0032986327